MNKHAPHAPGPRPNTWWKRLRKLRQLAPTSYADAPPLIYTKPEPKNTRKVRKQAKK